MDNTEKTSIKAYFEEENFENVQRRDSARTILPSKYLIPKHPGFTLVNIPGYETPFKLAYGNMYSHDYPDIEIELEQLKYWESKLYTLRKKDLVKEARRNVKHFYKKVISIGTPALAAGWNKWSEQILELFISEKVHKILWGSGNCGKSAITGALLYYKWRINPTERMVVIASSVKADADARVYAYLKEAHISCQSLGQLHPTVEFKSVTATSKINEGIYVVHQKGENGSKQTELSTRACIVSLPVKVKSKSNEIGSNLMGKHPRDRLIIAFDEAQELPARLQDEQIFMNWYTNERLDIYAWGNPRTIDYNLPDDHDVLFRLGAKKLSLDSLKKKAREAHKTSSWGWDDTVVLHLTMLDSPKDDPLDNYDILLENGATQKRLSFLGGKATAAQIAKNCTPNSPSWFSQVLGFPYIISQGSTRATVLTAGMVEQTKTYPLKWRSLPVHRQWWMAVDPAGTGKYDKAAIVCGETGLMVDGKIGIDLHHGKYSKSMLLTNEENFTDAVIEVMWQYSQELNIPLQRIAIETHGSGEVMRYAFLKHIQDTINRQRWAREYELGQKPYFINPTISPTKRMLFKTLGHMQQAKDMCADINTEYWVAVRCAVMTRQLFNIPDYMLQQFYSRELNTTNNGVKYKLETKEHLYASKKIRSPNDADALANLVELIRARSQFSYIYYGGAQYNEVYGKAYDNAKKQQLIDKQLGMVSAFLNLGVKLSSNGIQTGSFKEQVKPKKITYNI